MGGLIQSVCDIFCEEYTANEKGSPDAFFISLKFNGMDETQTQKEANPNASQPAPPVSEAPKDKDVEENKVVAALSYIGPLFFIPLFLKRESPFCQFHAKQGLAFFVVWMIGWIVFWFPILGQLLALVVFVVDVYALIKALQGEKWEVPVIGDLAKKINI